MYDRRGEPRLLCADLVDIEWKDKGGRLRRSAANLEDISLSGACVQLDDPIPLTTHVKIAYRGGDLTGHVRYCIYRDIGYFLGIAFGEGIRWSEGRYRPLHLLDPGDLVKRCLNRAEHRIKHKTGAG